MTRDIVRRARRRFARDLDRCVRRAGRGTIVCWGTGQLAEEVGRVLLARVSYYIDSNPQRQGSTFLHRPVRPPSALQQEDAAHLVVLVASMHDQEIRQTLASLLPGAAHAVVSVPPMHARAWTTPWWRRMLPAREAAPAQRKRSRLDVIRQRQRKILLVGGYGYQNVGDEAQLAATLEELRRRFPEYLLKVLTPNLQRTYAAHAGCAVAEAPRLAFYDEDVSPLYKLATRRHRMAFVVRSWWLLLHAWLLRAGVPIALMHPRRTALLQEIATARLLVFSGGGYLTGTTLSRLWDGAFLMRIARVLGTPVVLSGQTIGLWNSRFTERLARRALAGCEVIALRDGDASFEALAELALGTPRVMVTCDDALFGRTAGDDDALRRACERSGIDSSRLSGRYVVLNAHYFGLTEPEAQLGLLERVTAILDRLRAAGVPAVIGLPMVPGDAAILEELERARPDGWYRMLRTGDRLDLARAVIRGSQFCVSMKHHPIIFAVGECVPAISLTLGSYYEHKNRGALSLVGLGDCCVDLGDPGYLQAFDALHARVVAEGHQWREQIGSALQRLAGDRAAFFDAVEEVVAGPAGRP